MFVLNTNNSKSDNHSTNTFFSSKKPPTKRNNIDLRDVTKLQSVNTMIR